MSQVRRIVTDNSVLIPGFFKEKQTEQAKTLVHSILCGRVNVYIPEFAIHEFFKVALTSKAETLGREETLERIDDFLLRLVPRLIQIPPRDLCSRVLDIKNAGIRIPDAWYVACAMEHDAELWVSHEQKDELVLHARQIGVDARILTKWR